MAKVSLFAGTTSYIAQVFVQDSSSTTGAGLTGLAYNSAGLKAYYHRDTDTTATAITLVTMTVGAFTSSGFKEIDATNMPGWYQICLPNAILASGAKSAAVHLFGASNMAPLPLEIELTATNNQDGVRFGMTALPNAAAEAAGGLFTRGSGAGQINQSANGQVDVNMARILNTAVSTPATAGVLDVNVKNMNNVAATAITTINANQGTAQPINFTGTGASALTKSDMVDIAGAAVSTTTAQIGANVVQISGDGTAADNAESFFDGTGYAGTNNVIPTVTNLTNAPTNGDFTAAMKSSITAAVPTAAAIATGVWTDLLAGSDFSTASSIGKLLKDDVDAAISSRMATYTQPTGFLAATFPSTVASPTNITAGTITTVTNLTNAPTTGDFTATMKASITTAATAATPTAAAVTGAVGSVTGNVGGNVTGSIGSLASQAKTDVENAAWNATLSSHLTSGSTGAALNAAGAAGDPWSTTLPGAYGAGTAGYIVGTNVDALISSRLATAGYTAPLDAAATRTALGMTSANLDTQLAPMTLLDASVSSRLPTSSYSAAPSAAANATAIWAKTMEGSFTAADELRLIAAAAAAGRISGAGTETVTIRDLPNTKNRIVAAVDEDGNRLSFTTIDGA
jgi:hypothetical protein